MCFAFISEQKATFVPMYHKLIGFYNPDEVLTARHELDVLHETVFTSSLKSETK